MLRIPASPRYAAQWEVQSHSDPSKHYTISQKHDGTWQCSCPQWKFRRKICKHIQEVQRTQQTPARAPEIVGRISDGRAIFEGEEGLFIVDEDGDKQQVLV